LSIVVSTHLKLAPPATELEGPPTAVSAFLKNVQHAHAVAFRILGRAADVDDVLQDLFITAQRDLKDLSNDLAVRRWFTVATVRLSQRAARRARLRAFFALDEPGVTEVAAPGASPQVRSEVMTLFTVLDKLPVNARVAWTLRHLEGLSLSEVADVCGCSLATAKRRIAQAHDIIEEVWNG
jgi:RNA polymerase sigma-70 factor (ECF subfamily)